MGITRRLAFWAVSLGVSAGSAAQGESAAETVAAVELHPASRRLLEQHARHFIRTPDGAVWDLWGEQQYFELFNDRVRKEAIKKKRQNGILTYWDTVGFKWVINESTETKAWGLTSTHYWAREVTGQPPLRTTLHPKPEEFIHINEVRRDVVAEDEDRRCTHVVTEYGDKVFSVRILGGRGANLEGAAHPSRTAAGSLVVLPDRRIIKGGYLSGEFILWPTTIESPLREGQSSAAYRYIPIEDLRVSSEELEVAIAAGEAEIVTWEYRKHDGMWRWARKEHPLQYRPAREAKDALPEAPKEAPPTVPITHLLVLTDGSYVEGQLLAEDESGVRFLVVVNGIAAERTYARSEVGRVVEKD